MIPLRKRTRKERIADLERGIGKILHKIDADEDLLDKTSADALRKLQREMQSQNNSHAKSPSPSTELYTTSSYTEGIELTTLENAPLLSLFDNLVLSRQENGSVNGQEGNSKFIDYYNEKHVKILENMRDLMPSRPGLALILNESRAALLMFQEIFPELPGLKSFLENSEIEVLLEHMINTLVSDNVAAVAKVLVCLACCILRLPGKFDYPTTWFPAQLEFLQRCYMEFVDALLSPDEGLVASIDGVRCLIVQVRYYVNTGLPKKAWVIFRRALTFAQLLGGSLQSSTDMGQIQRVMWLQLWQYDKHLSLHLGLPYAISHLPFDTQHSEREFQRLLPLGVRFLFRLLTVSASVIDRNQQTKSPLISETLSVDLELEKCRQIMPMEWWNKIPDLETPVEEIHEMFTVKLWFYNIRNLIYLPFVSQSFMTQEYQWITDVVRESSREAIKCYGILRDDRRPFYGMCNLLDFQAFTAGMILILNLLANQVTSEDLEWESVYDLIQTFDRASQIKPNHVATRASKLLHELSKFRYHILENDEIFQAVVPYFGKITIKIFKGSTQHQVAEFSDLDNPFPGPSLSMHQSEPVVGFDHFLHIGNSPS